MEVAVIVIVVPDACGEPGAGDAFSTVHGLLVTLRAVPPWKASLQPKLSQVVPALLASRTQTE